MMVKKKIIWYCHCTESKKILYDASLGHTSLRFQEEFFLDCMYVYFSFFQFKQILTEISPGYILID